MQDKTVKDIIDILVAGKRVIDSKGSILSVKGFVLGSEFQDMTEGKDFDFDDLADLTPYVSQETKEIEKLTKLLEANAALLKERDKEILALKELNI